MPRYAVRSPWMSSRESSARFSVMRVVPWRLETVPVAVNTVAFPEGSRVVEETPAVPHALHSDQFVVAQCDRTPLFSVETFRDITHDRIRNGVFRSVNELVDAITEYVEHHNADPKTLSGPRRPKTSSRKSHEQKAALDKGRSA